MAASVNKSWAFLAGDQATMKWYKNNFAHTWAAGQDGWFVTKRDALAAARKFGASRSTPATHALLIKCSSMHDLPVNPPHIPVDMYEGNVVSTELVKL